MECGSRLPEQVEDNSPAATPSGILSSGLSAPPITSAVSQRSALRKDIVQAPPAKRHSIVGEFFKLAFVSFLLACLIQVLRAPAAIPPTLTGKAAPTAGTLALLEKSAQTKTPKLFPLSELNKFIASLAQQNPNEGVFLTLDVGEFNFFVTRDFHGLPIYFSMRVAPVQSEGKLVGNPRGAAIGRLQLPTFLSDVVQKQFQPALVRLAPAIALIEKAQAITITPDSVTLQWLEYSKATH